MVRRSRWQGRALFTVWLFGVGAMLTFFQYQTVSLFPALAWIVALLFSAGLAVQTWRRAPLGHLQWDGNTWHWSGFSGDAPCTAVLQMDCQQWLIVSLHQQGVCTVWLWLDGVPGDPGWQPLRRALVGSLLGIALANHHAGMATDDRGTV